MWNQSKSHIVSMHFLCFCRGKRFFVHRCPTIFPMHYSTSLLVPNRSSPMFLHFDTDFGIMTTQIQYVALMVVMSSCYDLGWKRHFKPELVGFSTTDSLLPLAILKLISLSCKSLQIFICIPFGGDYISDSIHFGVKYEILIVFNHPSLCDCLIPRALVSITYFFQFRHVNSSEPVEKLQVCICSVQFPLENFWSNDKLLFIYFLILT